MAIKISRISPTDLEMWDDKFDRRSMYIKVGRDRSGKWAVRAISGVLYSRNVGRWDSATEAVQAAVEYLKQGTDELDAAINSIPS